MRTTLPLPSAEAQAHSKRLCNLIHQDMAAQGGWIPFSRFMELALYAPGLGYYSAGSHKLGEDGDFVTAPEISPLFGRALARQVADIMPQSAPVIFELGAGSGRLAIDILSELERMGSLPERYDILEVSADLRERQQANLHKCIPHLAARVNWLDTLPEKISGAVIANEVLDALPVNLLRWTETGIAERGVVSQETEFAWHEQATENSVLREVAQKITVPDNYLSEISLAAHGLISTLCGRLDSGVLLFIDYGFGAREYYHPQRSEGTLMCHYRHHAHDYPFFLPGLQDITSHVDFSAVVETAFAQEANLLGYTTQANFLINCGITEFLSGYDPEKLRDYLPLSIQLQKLTSPAEMGDLFKVIALGKGVEEPLRGFIRGDKSHYL